jgi:1-acyl-sn-glycerol-3-phosphate acyltransferase
MPPMIARIRGLLLMGFWSLAVAIIAPVVVTLGRITGNENFIYTPVRFFVRIGLRLAGVRVEVAGLDRLDSAQTYVFTPNHQSVIEVPLMVTYLGRNPAFLAKKELFKIPIFSYGIRQIGIVPVDRSNSAAAVESARRATHNLQRGKSYVVYPEGTRSPDGRPLPFKKGAFLMAVDAGVPVVPVTVSGSFRVMPKGRVRIFPGIIRLTVHGPITTSGYSRENVSELVDRVRTTVLSALVEDQSRSEDATSRTKA